MRYAVKYPFRDRDGIERVPGDIMEIDDATRASSLQRRRLIGGAMKDPGYPIPQPGGYYLLPDGSRVRGKAAALEAMGGVTDA